MGTSERTKGHAFERKVARELRDIGVDDAMRNLEYQEGLGVDIEGDRHFIYQCKKGKRINELAAYKEMPENTDRIRVVVAGHDYDTTLACMSWEDFKVIRQWLMDAKVIN